MNVYRCRITRPATTAWVDLSAESPEQAAQDYFFNNYTWVPHFTLYIESTKEKVHIALVEVMGHETFVARTFSSGLYRKGGVQPRAPLTVTAVAAALGWTHDPQDLLTKGWPLEETYP